MFRSSMTIINQGTLSAPHLGDVAASRRAACVLCAVQNAPHLSDVAASRRAACVLCVVQSETVSLCTTHNTLAALRLAATSPNIYNDVILPSVLT